MTARKPRNAEKKTARRKLRLSKETLKDLTDAKGGVKGGQKNTEGQQNTDWISCSCVGC